DGRLYAVFECVPGSTLKEVLAREGSLGWGETVHLMTQVLDALSSAHERGVIHRDLKPEHIMVTKTGARRNALVLDVGLGGCRRSRRRRSSGATCRSRLSSRPSARSSRSRRRRRRRSGSPRVSGAS